MKATLIATVFNEIDGIKTFLDSVVEQTKSPDEFIIIDAGSTDGTIDVIKDYQKKYKWIKLIVKKNVSRGKGRNIAVKNAKNELIAVTDCGCILDKMWLKNIINPFKKDCDVVVGYYKPSYENDFGFFSGKMLVHEQIGKVYLISSRSLAFRKVVFEAAGGYDENVEVGEDTLFHWKIQNYKMVFQKNAIVYWQMPKNSKELFNKFLKYGSGFWQTIRLKEFRKFLYMILGAYFYSFVLTASLLTFHWELFGFLFLMLFLGLGLIGIRGVIATRRTKALIFFPLIFLIKNLAFAIGFTIVKFVRV